MGLALGQKRNKDSEMAKRLAAAPASHRRNSHTWPYHNNLGTVHRKPVAEEKLHSKPKRRGLHTNDALH